MMADKKRKRHGPSAHNARALIAIDHLSRMLRERVVPANRDHAVRQKAIDHLAGQNPRQIPTRPTPPRQHTVIAAPVTLGQPAGNSQQTADHVPADADHRGVHQNLETRPDRFRKLG